MNAKNIDLSGSVDQVHDAIPENLPRAVYEGDLDVCGFKLKVVVLDNGQRVFEDTPEFRRLLASLTKPEEIDDALLTQLAKEKT